jgi:nitrous oxide reductase accessory protein NosL
MRLTATLALTLCFLAGAALPAAASGGNERARRLPDLRDVRKIYVGDMGAADEADRFRFLLEEQLRKRGFTVVGSAAEADAVLTGALSVRVFDEKSEARAFVKLEDASGRRLWARDFGHKKFLVNPLSRQEPTKRRAEEVAKELRRDWERSK